MIRELVQRISGYPGLFLFCAISGIAFPLPEDFSLLYAGIKIHEGKLAWVPTLAVTIAGVGLRDVLAWAIGRYAGDWLLSREWAVWALGERKLERARHIVQEHGVASILIGRAFVGFRAPIFMVAGTMRLPLGQFLVWDGLGLLVVVPLTVALGFWFGDPLVEAVFGAVQYSRWVIVAAAVLLLWRFWRNLSAE